MRTGGAFFVILAELSWPCAAVTQRAKARHGIASEVNFTVNNNVIVFNPARNFDRGAKAGAASKIRFA